MASSIRKRSVIIHGHKTSVSLEEPFWVELKSIAASRRVTLQQLLAEIDANKQQNNLSSALRVFVLAACLETRQTAAPPQVHDYRVRRARTG